MKYRIAVVGPIPRDTITTHHGDVIQKYGCVTHPTIALAQLLKDEGEVIPIVNVHKADHEAIKQLFEPYANIDISGISSADDQGTIIDLKFIDQNNRIEKQMANMAPIGIANVQPYLDVDCFVFIPITDFEIELQTLKFIKENSSARIIFDAHGPTTYVDNKGNRLRQYWSDKADWLPFIDVLKMNLEESICSWRDQEYPSDYKFDEDDTSHLDAFAEAILSQGVKHLYVTLDSRGCSIFSNTPEGLSTQFVNSVPVDHVVDTTGCGDSFAGGLAYGFSVYDDAEKAAQFANVLGARRTQGKGFDVFKSLEETKVILSNHYSSFL